MPTKVPRMLLEVRYYKAAQEYLHNLPPEHFMESTPQATQREITLASLALVRGRRPDVQVFNELLVQYPRPRQKKPGQVVPDNMVVIHTEPIVAEGSYDVPLQPVRPFWVLEYVSKNNPRKDYEDSMQKYENELKVPYYLIFRPDLQELTLYRHTGKQYVTVRPDEHGRLPIPELDLAVALLDGWVRFWHKGELLPLPAELQQTLDETRQQLSDMTHRAEQEAKRAEQEAQHAKQEARCADAAEQEADRLRAKLQELQARLNGKH